jgi:glucokinase
MTEPQAWLVVDMGGTNTRCALGLPGGRPRAVARFRNRDHEGPVQVLSAYLAGLPAGERPRNALVAVAAPVSGEQVRMLNINWRFTADELSDRLGLDRVALLNDFAALAYALPVLGPGDLATVNQGIPRPREIPWETRVVLGPGTGLGTAGLVATGATGWQAVSAEGGHVTLPAVDAREETVVRTVRERLGHCSAEQLVSGPGFTLLHEVLHGERLPPEELTRRAADGDTKAADTVEMAFRFLGTTAGNLALSFGALGGVYIGGGIVPANLELFRRSGFLARFVDKGRYRDYLSAIPVHVITLPDPALTGLLARAAAIQD